MNTSLQGFEYYLSANTLADSTAGEHIKNIHYFKAWSKEYGYTDINHMRYADILSYVQHLKGKGLSVQTQNIRLNSIRKYYEYLKEEGITESNPARRLFIKGRIKKVIANPLSYPQLEQLYSEYAKPKEHYREKKHQAVHQRNTLIVGLMIWQGIHSGELGKIETGHVNLNEGLIYIPGGRRSNGRELKLESKQIILLHRYLTETTFTTEKLFECHPHNTIDRIVSELKGINPMVNNAQHLRASVILHWLRMYDKRTVQHMTGHKWISSTEHYQVQEIEGLTDLLSKHHPFG